MHRDLVDVLLNEVRHRPGMYLGSYAISYLPAFVAGFMIAVYVYDESKSGMDRFGQFQSWFNDRSKIKISSSYTLPFLELAGNDEKRALDLLFSELDEFAKQSGHCS